MSNWLEALDLLWQASPFILLVEVPSNVLLVLGLMHWWLRTNSTPSKTTLYCPTVSCVVTCYREGASIDLSLQSLWHQNYRGHIELIPVIDGGLANQATVDAVQNWQRQPPDFGLRSFCPIIKWTRGGRVSSLNAGLAAAHGEILLALDADTSFDLNAVAKMVQHFEDPCIQAVAGNLRVRNTWQSLATVMQAIEYLLSISMARIGFAEWNVLNNISGAFGGFRRDLVTQIGGWDTHSGEDLDLTIRLKSYLGRYPHWRIPFEPGAVGHTEVPSSFWSLMKQRLRWDGDLLFLYMRKHRGNFSPSLMGWRNFLVAVINGFFVQIILPLMIVVDAYVILLTRSWEDVLHLSITIYAAYLLLLSMQFILAMSLCSERATTDLKLLPFLPLFPIVMGFMRLWSAVAMLHELLNRAHEMTSMAPWWVIRRAHRF